MPLERLILMRHGKAEERAASGKDFDRALAARGHAEAFGMGRRLAEGGFALELALVSPARRALETWEEAGAAFPGVRVELDPALYHADPTALLEAAEASGAASVILVGHNPGLHALAFELANQGRAAPGAGPALSQGFPTAAVAVFRFEGGTAVCEAFFTPRDEAKP